MKELRPRSVTLASVYAGMVGGLLLFLCLNLATNWNTLEVRQQLETGLEAMGANTGFTADELLPMLRWVAMAGALASMSMIVFAIHTAKGHRGSRIGLTVLSVLGIIVFTLGGFAGFVPAAMLLLVMVMLWSAPSRQWFAIVDAGEGAEVTQRPDQFQLSFPPERNEGPGVLPSPPESTQGAAPVTPAWDEPALTAQRPVGFEQKPKMPTELLWAILVTGLGSAGMLLLSLLMLVASTVLREQVLAEMVKDENLMGSLEKLGQEPEALMQMLFVMSSLWAGLSLFGLVAVGLAFTRKRFAWVLLLLASVFTGLSGIILFPVGLLVTMVAGVVLALLLRAPVRTWFGSSRGS